MINIAEYNEVITTLNTPRDVYEEAITSNRIAVFTNTDGQVFVVFDPDLGVFVEYTTSQIVRVETVDVSIGRWKVYQKKEWFELASAEKPVMCKVQKLSLAPRYFYDLIVSKVGSTYTSLSGESYGSAAVTVVPLTDLELESFKRGL